jgi:two-component sensor histidine kinase
MLFLIIISDVFENGLDSPNTVIIVLIPFLSILIYDFKTSISLYLAGIIVFITIGYQFQNGMITSSYFDPTHHVFRHWVEVALVLSVVTVVITLFVHQFNTTIYKLINNLQSQKDDLADREAIMAVITKNIPRTYLTIIDSDLKIRFTDGSEYINTHLDPKQFIGVYAPDTFKQLGEETVDIVMNAYSQTLKGVGQSFELEFDNLSYIYKTVPLFDVNNQVHSFLVVCENITEFKETQKQIADRESLLSVITKNIPRTILTVLDRDLIIQFTDGIDYKKWKMDPESFVGLNALETLQVFGDDKVDRMKEAYENAFNGQTDTVELSFEGDILLYKILPLPDEDDEIRRILVVTENITEQVATQKLIDDNLNEKNVLLQEIHHRVKNNLAVVSGLLSLQSYKTKDPNSKFILDKSTNRIMSIAKVHEMLYESKNFTRIPFDRYINELSTIILDSMNYDAKTIQFNTEINVDYISINHGVPLGIIFNELITNSLKYGFNGDLDNSINITVNRENDHFHVTYEDNGVGIENFDDASSKSLGFTLVQSLMQQIDAEFEYDTRDKFKLSFQFPADSEESVIPVID